MTTQWINSPEDLSALIQELGFLPFFRNEIEGFSVEDHTPSHLWFSEIQDGPWEWKGPVASNGSCIYGKLFCNKAGFVSLDWAADFLNARRDGYDFDARYDDGLAPRKDKEIYDTLTAHGSLLTQDLKRLCNYRKGGNKGFDTVVTRLQMQTYLVISNFEYRTDRYGRPYGWGVARYSTPEALFGSDWVEHAYRRDHAESWQRMLEHLRHILPQASEGQIRRLLGVPKEFP
jgi:hypothetical protein